VFINAVTAHYLEAAPMNNPRIVLAAGQVEDCPDLGCNQNYGTAFTTPESFKNFIYLLLSRVGHPKEMIADMEV
jgi:hypothetical protein